MIVCGAFLYLTLVYFPFLVHAVVIAVLDGVGVASRGENLVMVIGQLVGQNFQLALVTE